MYYIFNSENYFYTTGVTTGEVYQMGLSDAVKHVHEEQDDAIFVLTRTRPNPQVRKFIAMTALKDENVAARMSVGSAVLNDLQEDRVKNVRKFAGPTFGLYDFLCLEETNTRQGSKNQLSVKILSHPAIKAIRYLRQYGADLDSLIYLVRRLGDIRVPLMGYNVERHGPASGYVVQRHPMFFPRVCEHAGSRMYAAAKDFVRTGKTTSALFLGTIGPDLYGGPEERTLLQSLVARHDNKATGVCFAAVLGVKILINEWLASEIHPDFFDESLFNDGAQTWVRKGEYRGAANA